MEPMKKVTIPRKNNHLLLLILNNLKNSQRRLNKTNLRKKNQKLKTQLSRNLKNKKPKAEGEESQGSKKIVLKPQISPEDIKPILEKKKMSE